LLYFYALNTFKINLHDLKILQCNQCGLLVNREPLILPIDRHCAWYNFFRIFNIFILFAWD